MPIIVAIISTLAFWLIYWFVRMGGMEQIQAARTQRRLLKARASDHIAPLRAVEDPRDAAMILMLLIARVDGDPTREHIAAVQTSARATFGFNHDLAARITQARFIAGRATSFEQAAAIFADLFNKRLTVDEKLQLVDMVRQIAKLDGPSEAQLQAVDALSRRITLAPAT
jgi:uncharacterized tellurite resistance protein B-like protein